MPTYEVRKYFSGYCTIKVDAINEDAAWDEVDKFHPETPEQEQEIIGTLEEMECSTDDDIELI